MPTSTRLAPARRTVLTTSLCAALAMSAAGTRHAEASPSFGNARVDSARHAPFATFSNRAAGEKREHVVSANVIPVMSCADDGSDGTLRKAIEGAGDGDTIDMSGLSCSLITLQSGALVSTLSNLSLKGPGVDALTIDGNNAGRVLTGYSLDITDLTIAHGAALSGPLGGCVYAYGDLSLTRARISACIDVNGNSSAIGGAAAVVGNLTMHDAEITSSQVIGTNVAAGGGVLVGGATTLYGSTISGNHVEASQGAAYGGGLYAIGTVVLHGSTIDGNAVHSAAERAYGGGMHSGASISVLDGSTISNNTASSDTTWSYGGGISSGLYGNPLPATVTINGSTMSGNTVSSLCSNCVIGGGAVHAFDSIASEYATFDDNHAVCDAASPCSATGGALSSFGSQGASSHISLRNVTISTNEALGGTGGQGLGGGVMSAADEQIFAHNATIAFNHASDLGGGIVASSGPNLPSELISTIVADNDTGAGPDDIAAAPFANSSVFSGSNNLVMAEGAPVTLPADTLSADPGLEPLTLADGGTTATHALPAGSVAIDAGANPDFLGCDQRGFPYRRNYGANVDIGAYEFQGEPHLFADNFDGAAPCPP
jgi:hypothetical protein